MAFWLKFLEDEDCILRFLEKNKGENGLQRSLENWLIFMAKMVLGPGFIEVNQ